MQKKYLSAPLPFVGQKRMFAKEFGRVLEQFSEATVFIDLFGGSGLLSHIAKRERPDATVVYNDYDNYRRRLENIPKTNVLLSDLRTVTADCPRKKIVPAGVKANILRRVALEEQAGFVDYITLSTSLLFSMKYVRNYESLCRETLYNRIKMTDYNADSYLDGLIIESGDYRDIFQKYRDIPGVVFLIDPPYLSTEVGTYNMSWKLTDYLDVLTVLSGTSFIYFTSNKSSIEELCEWIGRNNAIGNPFAGAGKKTFNAHTSYNAAYTDIMFYKKIVA
jgi:16S rRNA G966 N2-methylase RsmD